LTGSYVSSVTADDAIERISERDQSVKHGVTDRIATGSSLDVVKLVALMLIWLIIVHCPDSKGEVLQCRSCS